jgi:hypothetical protein
MVSLAIFVLVILLVGSMFTISQQSYNKGSDSAELTQNGRVTLDRISRELRQSVNIVTVLNPEGGLAEPEIFFQDGHDSSSITYIKYYLSGKDLMRRHIAYSFDSDPFFYVLKSSTDVSGDPPDEQFLETKIVGEYFNKLEFWGTSGLVTISAELDNAKSNIKIKTKIYSRNR